MLRMSSASGIDAAEVAFRDGARPDADREDRQDERRLDDRGPRPPDEQIHEQARRGPDRARCERKKAAVGDGGDENGDAGHALTTRVSAMRS